MKNLDNLSCYGDTGQSMGVGTLSPPLTLAQLDRPVRLDTTEVFVV